MQRIIGVLSVIVLVSCGKADKPADAKRVTLVPAPGGNGFDLSKDGRIAFSKYVNGKSAIYVANADGGGARRVSFGVWDNQPLWSPDGKWIAFARLNTNPDAVIVPADSGAEQVIPGAPAEQAPIAWLPDGSGLLFSRHTEHGDELWTYHPADRSSARLFEVDGNVWGFPSPDGKWIAYTRSKGGKFTTWLWDREKKTHRQLTTEGFDGIGRGCFSPDSRSLLYVSTRTGTADIWRVDVATGERQQLTQDVADDFAPRWSPDGTRIIFQSNRGGQPDLWVMSKGEADVQRVTNDAVYETAAVWTADGQSILTQVSLGHNHLYSLRVAGGPAVPLTSGDWDVGDAELSSDGSQVVYTGSKNGDYDIWTVPAVGGESHLVSGGPGYDGQGSLSPDGKRVVFVSRRSGNADIWIAPVDGGPAKQLVNWPSYESNARWSPDGKTISFLSNRDAPGSDIWTVSADGGAPRRITTLATVTSNYRWSPDGRAIAFAAQTAKSKTTVVFVVRAEGGEPKLLDSTSSDNPEWSPNGREIGIIEYSKGYARVVVRDPEGKLLRTLTPQSDAYEALVKWTHDGSTVAVGLQDLVGDGHFGVDVRPAAGGSTKRMEIPPGYNMFPLGGFAAGDSAVIATGGPNGSALQRIAVPPPIKSP